MKYQMKINFSQKKFVGGKKQGDNGTILETAASQLTSDMPKG